MYEEEVASGSIRTWKVLLPQSLAGNSWWKYRQLRESEIMLWNRNSEGGFGESSETRIPFQRQFSTARGPPIRLHVLKYCHLSHCQDDDWAPNIHPWGTNNILTIAGKMQVRCPVGISSPSKIRTCIRPWLVSKTVLYLWKERNKIWGSQHFRRMKGHYAADE